MKFTYKEFVYIRFINGLSEDEVYLRDFLRSFTGVIDVDLPKVDLRKHSLRAPYPHQNFPFLASSDLRHQIKRNIFPSIHPKRVGQICRISNSRKDGGNEKNRSEKNEPKLRWYTPAVCYGVRYAADADLELAHQFICLFTLVKLS